MSGIRETLYIDGVLTIMTNMASRDKTKYVEAIISFCLRLFGVSSMTYYV
ncbi:hypothetical protein [Psychromonas sp. Urea-02u-13]|nr:hypothetical protein [Psychromonas sp. Urea-02u-13]